jgi:hypothetical protein
MRLLIITAAVVALVLPATAQQQQQRPQTSPSGQPRQAPQQSPSGQQRQAPQAAPAPAPAPQAQETPPVPGMFACRTEQEICYVGIALPGGQMSVLFTNNESAEGIDAKPQAVAGADLNPHVGRVVMVVGQYNAQSGLSGAEVVDVAGPLLSFAIKSQLSNTGGDEEEEPEPPPPPAKQQPRQQQRR